MSTVEIKETKAVRTQRKTERMSRASYRTMGNLQIPEQLEAYYKEKGFKLRWVRCIDPKTRGFDNSKATFILDIGGGFVSPKELRSIAPSFMAGLTRYDFTDDMAFEEDEKRDATGVRYIDVVLMKLPIDYVEERQAVIDEQTQAQLESAFQHTKKAGGKVKLQAQSGYMKTNAATGETFFS